LIKFANCGKFEPSGITIFLTIDLYLLTLKKLLKSILMRFLKSLIFSGFLVFSGVGEHGLCLRIGEYALHRFYFVKSFQIGKVHLPSMVYGKEGQI
ncbi:MAG: hypothetical protein Q4P14_05085, partial [Methanobacteriaceae archaeon]|nr:hypothetical protein [Methanobacteriaceae archaeon]